MLVYKLDYGCTYLQILAVVKKGIIFNKIIYYNSLGQLYYILYRLLDEELLLINNKYSSFLVKSCLYSKLYYISGILLRGLNWFLGSI